MANISSEMESPAGTNSLKSMIDSDKCKLKELLKPELLSKARYAAAEWHDKLRRPSPPLLRLNCASIQSISEVFNAVHSEKHWRISLSNKAKPSEMYEGGVERARCTNLQNAAHCRTSANWDRSFAASARFCAKNLAQKWDYQLVHQESRG